RRAQAAGALRRALRAQRRRRRAADRARPTPRSGGRMRVDVITIFPELFEPFLRTSLVGRAVEAGLLTVAVHDLREWSVDPHRSVDDEPYGGGGGMVMTAPPWIAAVGAVAAGAEPWRVLLSPQGAALTDAKVRELERR